MTVDKKVQALAEGIIEDYDWIKFDRVDALAAFIQDAIEEWIANEESNQETGGDARTAEDWKTHAE